MDGNNNLEKIIKDFEDIAGKIKDTKDQNSIVTNILKKKNSKNHADIIINFINYLPQIKEFYKNDKKVQSSLYSILYKPNGDEIFIKSFLSKLEDRNCNNIIKSLSENSHKLLKYKDLMNSRLSDQNLIFIEKFKDSINHSNLLSSFMTSNYAEDNMINHFIQLWNNFENLNYTVNPNSVFYSSTNFKHEFLSNLKEAIINQKYSIDFIKNLFKNNKLPSQFKNMFEEINLKIRIDIDSFLNEFKGLNFIGVLLEIFNKNKEMNLLLYVLHNLSFIETNYKKEIFKDNELFKLLFSDKQKFFYYLAEEFFKHSLELFKISPNFFQRLKIDLLEVDLFKMTYENIRKELKNKIEHSIIFLNSIYGKTYEIICNNLLIYLIQQNNFNFFFSFLIEEINFNLVNYILSDNYLSTCEPFMDLVNYSKETFIENLSKRLILIKNFTNQRNTVLRIIINYCKLKQPIINSISDIIKKTDEIERKKIKNLYSRYLAYEIDIFFILDFIQINDFEKISLLINRLIRSQRYEDALNIIYLFKCDEKIHIEEVYQKEIMDSYFNNKIFKRNLQFSEVEEADDKNYTEYDINYDENFDQDIIDSDEEEVKVKNYEFNKKKKTIDYIMYYEYKSSKKINSQEFEKFMHDINFNPKFKFDRFAPVSCNTISLDIPKENIYFIETIKDLKKIGNTCGQKLCLNFELTDDCMSLITISDKHFVYIIDYFQLNFEEGFFSCFHNIFKNASFISYSMDRKDLLLLNEDFRDFFNKRLNEDIKSILKDIYETNNIPSLSNLALLYMGMPLCKYYQCSNWNKRPLLEGQIHYAALDNYILHKLYSFVKQNNFEKVIQKKKLCELVKIDNDKSFYNLRTFAKDQIIFLKNEQQFIENINREIYIKYIDELEMSHKVIKSIYYIKNEDNILTLYFNDVLNLIKIGDKVGVFEILENRRVMPIGQGKVEDTSFGKISIVDFSENTASLKNLNICLIQLSDDLYKSMVRTMIKLKKGIFPKYCLEIAKLCFTYKGYKINDSFEFKLKDNDFFLKRLNDVQKNIINYVISNDLPVSLIQGPPGTGKSYIIKEIIAQSLKRGEKILVTAFSNSGCDNVANIIEFLESENFKIFKKHQFLRLGNSNKIKSYIKDISLDQLQNLSVYKQLIEQIQKTKYNREDEYILKDREKELENNLNKYNEILIEKADVIFSTCVSSGSFILRKFLENRKTYFDLVIIDESSQALEAACWIPILTGKKVLIVGDSKQIGPIINSVTTRDTFTLYERLEKLYGNQICRMLDTQFRMHEKIMEFSSKYFYQGLVKADISVSKQTLADKFLYKEIFSKIKISGDKLNLFKEPLIVVNTSDYCKENRSSKSKYNIGEESIVQWFVKYLVSNNVKENDIGIITPYMAQVHYIKKNLKYKIEVSTVDAYQGSEKQVIIISFVRSNDKNEIGFLADQKRINVALTRAKKLLILIFDPDTMNSNVFLRELTNFYMNNSRILTPDITKNEII